MVQTLNIVIPARNEYPWLPWTVYSYIADIPEDVDWHITIASNGADPEQKKMDEWFKHGTLARRGHLSLETFEEAVHPHICVQRVSEKLDDGVLMWSCGHISIARGTIGKMLSLVEREDVGLVHSPQLHMFDFPDESGRSKLYGYKDPLHRGWSWQRHGEAPYKWHSGSCALVCVKLSDWREVGGEDVPFRRGIGGCETLIDMKMWMFGKSVWIHPDCLYWHWVATRGFTWTMGEHEWNQLVAYYCLGGRELMETENKALSYPQSQDVLNEVETLCKQHRQFIVENAKFTLEQVLQNQPWLH